MKLQPAEVFKHSIFFEETIVNTAGRRVRVRRAFVRPVPFYVVSVDGRRVDSFVRLGKARRLAKTLCETLGAVVPPVVYEMRRAA